MNKIQDGADTCFTDYRSFADTFLTLLDMGNISFISLVYLNFPAILRIHALPIGLTTFGIKQSYLTHYLYSIKQSYLMQKVKHICHTDFME